MSGAFYTVQSGDTLSKIAQRFGLANWQVIYNDPQNADFQNSHPDPNLIFRGDVIWLPTVKLNKKIDPSGKKYKYKHVEKKILTVDWQNADAFCGDFVKVLATAQDFKDGDRITVDIKEKASGKLVDSPIGTINSGVLQAIWEVKNILPKKNGTDFESKSPYVATAKGATSSCDFIVKFIPNLPKTDYSVGRAHFSLSAYNYVVTIESALKYVKGWGASVVRLENSVPAGTGGIIADLSWPGYRWMKRVGVTPKYWDGSSWNDLPAGFTLRDTNNFCVGFYKVAGLTVRPGSILPSLSCYKCQHGGVWPEAFADWDIAAAPNAKKIADWEKCIKTTWEAKFSLKRKDCKSTDTSCCRYSTKTSVSFVKNETFQTGFLIIADGNIRSNDALFFIGEPRIVMAAHEFGHHIGNPDEYAGAAIDAALNDDGAVNGIDSDSIMGQNLTNVKKRHFRTICLHLTKMIRTATGREYTFVAV
jgi:LysM repeat protein